MELYSWSFAGLFMIYQNLEFWINISALACGCEYFLECVLAINCRHKTLSSKIVLKN